jgi:DNA-binding Lrp family transcriptional regulator
VVSVEREMIRVEEIKRLEDFEKVRGKLRLPIDVKPCIAKLLDDPSVREGDNPFIVAVELHRVGRTERQIDSLLTRLGIRTSKIRGVIKSVASGRYEFGCPTLEEKGICLYEKREDCFWYQAIPRESQRSYRERDFWRFGWPGRLTAPEIVIYLAIGEVEKRRGLPAGSRLYVSRKELMGISGISHSWVLECCEKLKKKGLIKFKRGTQHRWYGKASEVKRIIPIPRPE